MTPLVSVTLPAFNNQKHIRPAIQSVLDQSFTDLELIVVDDGSLDRTAEIVRSFTDPRIVFFSQENRGGADATNRAIRAARGQYVALFAGDDVCHPQRIERQLQHLKETGAGASFTWTDLIDEDGNPMTGTAHFASGWFNHPSRSRAEMVRWLFQRGNYLCSPSGLIERWRLLEAGLFCPTDAQVPDLRMWFELLRRGELPVLAECLMSYRVRAAESNVSGPGNANRAYFELACVYREQLPLVPDDLFREAFAADLRRPDFVDGPERRLEEAFLFLRHPLPCVRHLGAESLHTLLREPDIQSLAASRYRFALADLLLVTNSLDTFATAELLTLRRILLAEGGNLRVARDALIAEYIKLEAYTREVLAAKDSVETEYRKLEVYARDVLAARDRAEAEYLKLDAYTREVLAAKDAAQAETRELEARFDALPEEKRVEGERDR